MPKFLRRRPLLLGGAISLLTHIVNLSSSLSKTQRRPHKELSCVDPLLLKLGDLFFVSPRWPRRFFWVAIPKNGTSLLLGQFVGRRE